MTSMIRVVSILGGFLVAVAGCGFTGVGGGKQVDSLSDEDRTQICERTVEHFEEEGYYEDFARLICVGTSAAAVSLGGGDAAACELAVSMCLKDAEAGGDGDTCADTSPLTSCTATVREYEDCIDEQIEAMKEAVASFDCAAALSGAQAPEMAAGPACQALSKKCPDIFSGQGEGT